MRRAQVPAEHHAQDGLVPGPDPPGGAGDPEDAGPVVAPTRRPEGWDGSQWHSFIFFSNRLTRDVSLGIVCVKLEVRFEAITLSIEDTKL